jgi:hypothetical protein
VWFMDIASLFSDDGRQAAINRLWGGLPVEIPKPEEMTVILTGACPDRAGITHSVTVASCRSPGKGITPGAPAGADVLPGAGCQITTGRFSPFCPREGRFFRVLIPAYLLQGSPDR